MPVPMSETKYIMQKKRNAKNPEFNLHCKSSKLLEDKIKMP